jgi:hypothetical protein
MRRHRERPVARPVGSTSFRPKCPVHRPFPSASCHATDWPSLADQALARTGAADDKDEGEKGGEL